jgi:hypothetical protein
VAAIDPSSSSTSLPTWVGAVGLALGSALGAAACFGIVAFL